MGGLMCNQWILLEDQAGKEPEVDLKSTQVGAKEVRDPEKQARDRELGGSSEEESEGWEL